MLRFSFQVKLHGNREQLLLVRKQLENSEQNSAALEDRVKELVHQLDASRTQCSHSLQERDSLQKALEAVKAEKLALERNRIEINAMVSPENSPCRFPVFVHLNRIFRVQENPPLFFHSSYQDFYFLDGALRPVLGFLPQGGVHPRKV